MGMNMGVIREIELLESSFVDPITKTVLEEKTLENRALKAYIKDWSETES